MFQVQFHYPTGWGVRRGSEQVEFDTLLNARDWFKGRCWGDFNNSDFRILDMETLEVYPVVERKVPCVPIRSDDFERALWEEHKKRGTSGHGIRASDIVIDESQGYLKRKTPPFWPNRRKNHLLRKWVEKKHDEYIHVGKSKEFLVGIRQGLKFWNF